MRALGPSAKAGELVENVRGPLGAQGVVGGGAEAFELAEECSRALGVRGEVWR